MQKLLFTLLAFVGFSVATMAHEGYHVGDAISNFSLKNVNGKNVSLSDYKDAKGFIITFTCNHCPYSVAYEDRIIALHNTYAAKGYPVIAINPNDAVQYPSDNFENMQIRAKEKKFPFVYLHDETQEVAKKFGALRTPHMFVVQKSGDKYVVKYIGAIDDNWEDAAAVTEKYVESAVNALLNGQTVALPNTKAIGCSIKWKK
jgi:peroxiredoxin